MRTLSFCTAVYTGETPVINGKLDDQCWKRAEVYSSYYEYFKPNPGQGGLKTELRMLWNEQGIFLGITNYDAKVSQMKATHTTRDASDLWEDDCVELFFDPQAEGIGFTKFVINSLGTISDMRQIDAAVTLDDWNASGLEVATSMRSDAWIIEMFVPWSDLGQLPTTGSIWKFCNVRYAWSNGTFIGVTSSPGGNYSNTGGFGFLYFSDGKPLDSEQTARLLAGKASPPWCLVSGDILQTHDGKEIKRETILAVINRELAKFDKLSQAINAKQQSASPENKKEFQQLQKTYDAVKAGKDFNGLKALLQLNLSATELLRKIEITELMNSVK
ncbi:MAG: sugar-binding protein [Victivallaceae bacterium]